MVAKRKNVSVADLAAREHAGKTAALKERVLQADERIRRQSESIATLQKLVAEYENMLSMVDEVDGKVKPMAVRPLAKNAAGEAVAMGVFSDAHMFETVFKTQVSGLNAYDKSIARASCEEFFRACLKWTNIHRAGVAVPQFVLALLGDIMTNQLHLDHLETNAGTPQEELLFCLEILNGGIDFLLREGKFEKLTVVCCDGNHGRATEKLQIKNRSKHSHEWLLYQMMARMYNNDERVEFVIADGMHVYLPVFDKIVRFCHGDAFKYEGGVGGLTIPVRKAINEWNKAKWADLDVFGHWHTRIFDGQFISNGSVMGYSEFSVARRLSFEPPQQSFALLDKRRWVTSLNPIYVR
jgi:hypothetical protein